LRWQTLFSLGGMNIDQDFYINFTIKLKFNFLTAG